MAKIYEIEIEGKGKTSKEIKEEIVKILEEVFKEEKEPVSNKELENYCNKAIISFVGLAKALVCNEVFDELANNYIDYMLKTNLDRKFSFVKNFTLAVEDVVDDIVGLVEEHKMLSKEKNKGNEKKVTQKRVN